MKFKIYTLIGFLFGIFPTFSQQLTLQSPNKKNVVELLSMNGSNRGEWYLKVSYNADKNKSEILPKVNLGLSRSDQDFSKELLFIKASKPKIIKEHYELPFGKKEVRDNEANEIIVSFENPSKAKLNLIIRAYNDGITFRYEFPEKQGTYNLKDEFTAYEIPNKSMRWLEKWNPANEGLYAASSEDKVLQQEWCYPALFNSVDKSCWYLLHEADLDRNYCGTKLSNTQDKNTYKLTFPDPKDGRSTGESNQSISLP